MGTEERGPGMAREKRDVCSRAVESLEYRPGIRRGY